MMSQRIARELLAIDQAFAQAGERAKDAERSQRVLSALRWMVAEPDILAKAGYALVPLEPTEAMVEAAVRSFVRENHGIEHAPAVTWRAMVAAAAETDGEASDGGDYPT